MTDLMKRILAHMAETNRPETPNEIGYSVGAVQKQSGFSGTQYRSRGPGSIISPALTSLARQNLIRMTARPDGMTGTAYRITDAGREELST